MAGRSDLLTSQWKAQRLRVLDRDGWVCAACGKDLAGDDATVDHIVPVAVSGATSWTDDELVSLCRVCNSRKGATVGARLDYRSPRWFDSA